MFPLPGKFRKSNREKGKQARVTYGNHFWDPSDRVMMMRHEGHTPYSGLPTILRLSHFASHAISSPLFDQFTHM